MPRDERHTATIPYGTLGIIPLSSCAKMGEKVDKYLVEWREQREHDNASALSFAGYKRDSYILDAKTPRFGSGEGKGVLNDSVRGCDLYIMVDVCNYSIEYSLCGFKNRMSPDDHYADLKRVISAAGGKARRINVIMPFLYESRQHKRSGRESLDCALMLQELTDMGVENIITFDAHDPRVHNAIPLKGFESVSCTYQFIKYLLLGVDDLHIDSQHMMVISPDEGGMGRAVYFANVLGLDMGMFYKRRDYTKIINGRNPIVAHEFLGTNVEGKDVISIDSITDVVGQPLDSYIGYGNQTETVLFLAGLSFPKTYIGDLKKSIMDEQERAQAILEDDDIEMDDGINFLASVKKPVAEKKVETKKSARDMFLANRNK